MESAYIVVFLVPYIVCAIVAYAVLARHLSVGLGIAVVVVTIMAPAYWFTDYYAITKGLSKDWLTHLRYLALFAIVSAAMALAGIGSGIFFQMIVKEVT
ncbi:MAG: hypothetical protein WA021_04525, partial [Minisyncoccia bacterium]